MTEAEFQAGVCSVCGPDKNSALASAPVPRLASNPPVSVTSEPASPPPPAPEQAARNVGWFYLLVVFLLVAILLLNLARPVTHSASLRSEAGSELDAVKRVEEHILNRLALHAEHEAKTNERLQDIEKRLQRWEAKLDQTEYDRVAEQLTRIETRLANLRLDGNPPPPPKIRVVSRDWGGAVPEDVQAVCISAASEIWKHTSQRKLDPITVTHGEKGPMILHGRGADGEIRIILSVKGNHWAQCAYQFAHEFCHALCNSREAKNPNLWFEESLCEAASVFVLRQMAESWQTNPPYPSWKSFSPALADYAVNLRRETPVINEQTLAEWYRRNEKHLRMNATDRPLNRVVAMALVRLLERDPHHWQALAYLNQWNTKETDLSFEAYLTDWHRRVPEAQRSFVKEIGTLFEYDLK
jgi:tetrahydromethanopterin S-methyltransferase subunit G